MIQGFKDFVLRGNVVELAVAVVIGTAFAAVVSAVVTNLISPLLARAGGGEVGDGLGIQLGTDGNPATFIDIGAMINALVVFLLTALVVYVVIVVPTNTMIARFRTPEEEVAEVVSEELVTLREIRDLLARRGDGQPLP